MTISSDLNHPDVREYISDRQLNIKISHFANIFRRVEAVMEDHLHLNVHRFGIESYEH